MANIAEDAVQETSTTTGTGAFTLAGAVTGFRTFASVITALADTCIYRIEAVDSNGVPTGEWEIGNGTYSAANTLTRSSVIKSSNSNALVSFSAGTKRVFITLSISSAAGDSTKFLSGDGQWRNPAQTIMSADVYLGATGKRSGTITITGQVGLPVGAPITMKAAAGPYFLKGRLSDEAQMDAISLSAVATSPTTITVQWSSGRRMRGWIRVAYSVSGYALPTPPSLAVNDASRLWLTRAQSVVAGGALFLCSVSGNATSGAIEMHRVMGTKRATFVIETQSVATGTSDDHNDPSAAVLSTGQLLAACSQHGDGQGTTLKVSNYAAPFIGGFGKRIIVTASNAVSYNHMFVTGNGIVVGFRRNQGGTNYTQEMFWTTEVQLLAEANGGAAAVWNKQLIFNSVIETGARAYAIYKQHRTQPNRILIETTSGHPGEVATVGIYGAYVDFSTGSPLFYDCDGTAIVAAQPFEVRTYMTVIQSCPGDGTNKGWVADVDTDADGNMVFLTTKYPTTSPSADNNIEYWRHKKVAGGAVTSVRLSQFNRSLFSSQEHYAGSLSFDGNDTSKDWRAEWSLATGKYEIRQYQFNDATGAQTLLYQVPPGSTYNRIRPHSPRGYNPGQACNYVSGSYTDYTLFSMGMSILGTITTFATPLAYDALTAALAARCTTSPSTTLKDIWDRFFVALKAGETSGTNFFTANKFGLLQFPMAMPSATDAVRDALSATNDVTLVNTGSTAVWTASKGWKTGASSTTDYLTGKSPATVPNWAQDNAHLFGFAFGQGTGANRAIARRVAGGVPTIITPDNNSALIRVNGSPGVSNASNLSMVDSGPCIVGGSRIAANALSSYLNAALVGTDASASAAPDTDAMIFAYQMTVEMGFMSMGAGLTAREECDLTLAIYAMYRELTMSNVF